MAGKNQVTLTFAGDASKLKSEIDSVGQASRDMAKDVEKSGKEMSDGFDRAGEGLDNTYDKFDSLEAIGRGTSDTMSGLGEIMSGNVLQGATDLAGGVAALADGIAGAMIPALKRGVTWIKNTTVAQKAMNLAMRLNPIGLVITALLLLGAGLVLAWKKSETFRTVVTGALNAVKVGVMAVVDFFKNLGGWIARAVGYLGDLLTQKGKDVIGGFLVGLRRISEVYLFMIRLPFRILGWIGNAGAWLVQKGKDVLGGFLHGLGEKWREVTQWVAGIAKWIKDHKGPVSLDAQLLVPAGRAIMGGFLSGLKSGAGPAWSFVKSVGGKTVDELRKTLGFVIGGFTNGTGSNIDIGKAMAASVGWTGDQWRALYSLWWNESSWNNLAKNPNSTAFGIPQFLDSTARQYGVLHDTDPRHQIAAGMRYIHDAYGSPLNAWNAWQSRSPHWYEKGTSWVPEDGFAYLHQGERVVTREENRRRAGAGRVEIVIRSGGSRLDDVLVEVLRKAIQNKGGNVQSVLGSR